LKIKNFIIELFMINNYINANNVVKFKVIFNAHSYISTYHIIIWGVKINQLKSHGFSGGTCTKNIGVPN